MNSETRDACMASFAAAQRRADADPNVVLPMNPSSMAGFLLTISASPIDAADRCPEESRFWGAVKAELLLIHVEEEPVRDVQHWAGGAGELAEVG